jgi:hypothetical protein
MSRLPLAFRFSCLLPFLLFLAASYASADEPVVIRSARSGPWSQPETWKVDKRPANRPAC